MKRTEYSTPFYIKDGTIFDSANREVRLWGVNYYVPFNHNYYNIEELGKNHFRAIDDDLRHFRLLGINFIRMHLYDREITRRNGTLVENQQMKILDYLIDQCEKQKIYLQITMIAWWNTVRNELLLQKSYAFWHIDPDDTFGFSNFFSKDAMLWHPDAIRCQQTYFREFFTRKNTVSGKTLPEYANLISIELFNEVSYPNWKDFEYWTLHQDRTTETSASLRGAERDIFLSMWKCYQEKHPELSNDESCFSAFRTEIVNAYLNSLIPIIREFFGDRVILAKYGGHGGSASDLRNVMQKHGVQALTMNGYLTVKGFDSMNTNHINFLPKAEEYLAKNFNGFENFVRMCYEYNAVSTENGYPLAALACAFAEMKVQSAAYFTYTPDAVAAWNPGWLTHYFNIQHTPSRAACFAAAGEIFKTHSRGLAVYRSEKEWKSEKFHIQPEEDLVWFKNETVFRYSNDNDVELGDISRLELVSGRGKSRFASCSGNGFYVLERTEKNVWNLTLFPSQRYLMVPERIQQNHFMANRFISCIAAPPVSQLLETKLEFRLNALRVRSVTAKSGEIIEISENGTFTVEAGEFQIITV